MKVDGGCEVVVWFEDLGRGASAVESRRSRR